MSCSCTVEFYVVSTFSLTECRQRRIMGSSAILLTMVKDTCTTCIMRVLSVGDPSDTLDLIYPEPAKTANSALHRHRGSVSARLIVG